MNKSIIEDWKIFRVEKLTHGGGMGCAVQVGKSIDDSSMTAFWCLLSSVPIMKYTKNNFFFFFVIY
jgi:hypothetical protein